MCIGARVSRTGQSSVYFKETDDCGVRYGDLILCHCERRRTGSESNLTQKESARLLANSCCHCLKKTPRNLIGR
jgi:hypothetical protein